VSARCSDCGKAAPDGIDRRDAANRKHRYHIDCWARVVWWLNGHDTKPTRSHMAKIRAAFADAKVTP